MGERGEQRERVYLYDFSGVDKEGETVSQDFLYSFSAPEVLKTQKSLFSSDVYCAAKCFFFALRCGDSRFHLYDDRYVPLSPLI